MHTLIFFFFFCICFCCCTSLRDVRRFLRRRWRFARSDVNETTVAHKAALVIFFFFSRLCQEAVGRTALCRSGFFSHVRHDPSEIARPSSFFLYPPPFLFVRSRFFWRLSRRLPRLLSLPTAVSPQHWGLISSGILVLHNGEEAWRCHSLHIYLLATCLL